jgi:hypothetical protein
LNILKSNKSKERVPALNTRAQLKFIPRFDSRESLPLKLDQNIAVQMQSLFQEDHNLVLKVTVIGIFQDVKLMKLSGFKRLSKEMQLVKF